MSANIIRRFRLLDTTWTVKDTGKYDRRGQTLMSVKVTADGETWYEGDGFAGSPMHADDSDATMRAIVDLAIHDNSHCKSCDLSSRYCKCTPRFETGALGGDDGDLANAAFDKFGE